MCARGMELAQMLRMKLSVIWLADFKSANIYIEYICSYMCVQYHVSKLISTTSSMNLLIHMFEFSAVITLGPALRAQGFPEPEGCQEPFQEVLTPTELEDDKKDTVGV